jgi:hypothetical protein
LKSVTPPVGRSLLLVAGLWKPQPERLQRFAVGQVSNRDRISYRLGCQSLQDFFLKKRR